MQDRIALGNLTKPEKINPAEELKRLGEQLQLEKAMKTSALVNEGDDEATREAVRASARFDKLALLLEHADVAIERFFTWPERWTRDHASDDTQPRLAFAAHHTIAFVFDNGFEYRRDGGVPVPLRAVTLERADRLVLTPFRTPPPSRPASPSDEDRARVEATAQATAREAERVALKLVSAACDFAYGPPGVLAAVEGNAAERDARFADGASSSTLRGVELVRVPPSMWPAWRHARFRVRAISAALHTSTAGVAFARLRRVGVDANGTLFYEFDAPPRHHAPSPWSERTVRLPPSVVVPGVARDASVEFALACLCMAALGMVVDAHASPRMAYDAVRPMDARDPPPAHATRLAAGQLTLCVLGKPAAYRDDAVPDGRLDVHVPMGGWRLAPAEAARACDALLDSLRPWLSGVYASSSAPTGDKRNSPLEPATRDARYGSSALRRMWGGKAAAGYDKAPPPAPAPLAPLAAGGKGVGLLIGDRYVREGEENSLSWPEWEQSVGAEAATSTVWDTPTLAVKQPSPPESRDGSTTQEQSMYALPLREGARGASDGSAGSLAAAAGRADRLLAKRRQQELALASVDLSDAALERGQTHLGALREALRLADENRAHLVLVQHARPQMAYLDVHPHYKWYLVPTRAGRRPTEREAEATAEAAAAAPSPLGLFVRKGSSWSVESYSECDPLRSDAALAELDVGARVARVELRHASEPAQGRRVWLVNAQSCHDTFAVEASRRAALLIDCDAAASLLAKAKKTFYDAVVAPCGAGAAGPVPDVVVGVFDDWDDVRVRAWTDLREEAKYDAAYVDRCFAKEDPIADENLKKTLFALGRPATGSTDPFTQEPYQLSTKWLDRLHQHFRQSLLAQEERAIDHVPFRDTRFVSTRRLTAAHGRLLARCSAVGNAPNTPYHVVRTYLAWREASELLRECFRVVVEAKPDAADALHQTNFRTNDRSDSAPETLPKVPRGDVTEAGLMAQLLEDVKSVRQAQHFIEENHSRFLRAVSPEEEARRGVLGVLLDRRTDPLAAHALTLVRDALPYLSATHDGRADKRGKTGAPAAGASAADAGRRLLSADANAHKSSLPACRYPLWELGRPDEFSVAVQDGDAEEFLTAVFLRRAPPAAATPLSSHF